MMDIETTLRLSEMLLALAIIQHSAEHMVTPRDERWLFAPRILLAVLLALGLAVPWVLAALWLIGLMILNRFDGPYNGGADKMVLLVSTCLLLAHLAPNAYWQEMALSYLAVQLVLSYFVSGWVKVINPAWRGGEALGDVFRFSAYPVSRSLRKMAHRPALLLAGSWAVMGLELIFPLSLLHPLTLALALCATAAFHISNACLFGLNRFFWAWLSAYPALLWFQGRIFG